MVWAQALLIDGERAAIKRLSLRKTVRGLQQLRQIAVPGICLIAECFVISGLRLPLFERK
jgi:hypothetical protein